MSIVKGKVASREEYEGVSSHWNTYSTYSEMKKGKEDFCSTLAEAYKIILLSYVN